MTNSKSKTDHTVMSTARQKFFLIFIFKDYLLEMKVLGQWCTLLTVFATVDIVFSKGLCQLHSVSQLVGLAWSSFHVAPESS